MRYASDTQVRVGTSDRCTSDTSPDNNPATRQPMPPQSISMPVITNGLRGIGAVRDQTDPADQHTAASTSSTTPTALTRPPPLPTTSTATPAKPSSRPIA